MILIKETEKISFYTHFLGFIAAVVGTLFLIVYTWGDLDKIIISVIYGFSIITLFLASSMYHYFKKEDDESSLWRKLDHFAIFIMIAGTYTPVTYIFLSGYWKWTILGLQWTLVLGGFFFKFYYLKAPRYLYTIIYLLMGWVGIIPIRKFIATMPATALFYMFTGGIAYTIGAVFYMTKLPKFNKNFGFHEIFHLFIILGGAFHYLLVLEAIKI